MQNKLLYLLTLLIPIMDLFAGYISLIFKAIIIVILLIKSLKNKENFKTLLLFIIYFIVNLVYVLVHNINPINLLYLLNLFILPILLLQDLELKPKIIYILFLEYFIISIYKANYLLTLLFLMPFILKYIFNSYNNLLKYIGIILLILLALLYNSNIYYLELIVLLIYFIFRNIHKSFNKRLELLVLYMAILLMIIVNFDYFKTLVIDSKILESLNEYKNIINNSNSLEKLLGFRVNNNYFYGILNILMYIFLLKNRVNKNNILIILFTTLLGFINYNSIFLIGGLILFIKTDNKKAIICENIKILNTEICLNNFVMFIKLLINNYKYIIYKKSKWYFRFLTKTRKIQLVDNNRLDLNVDKYVVINKKIKEKILINKEINSDKIVIANYKRSNNKKLEDIIFN